MKLPLALGLTLCLTGCGGSGSHHSAPVPQPAPTPGQTQWVIGPWISGTNYSKGMPVSPTMQVDGFTFAFPKSPGHVNYVQNKSPPSLVGAKSITIRFTVTGGGFVAFDHPDQPATVSLCLQRRGDDWSAKGAMADYRLYSRQSIVLHAGNGELTVPLTPASLGNVNGKTPDQAAVDATLRSLDNIAVVFGSSSGAGHGVYAMQTSKFTLTEVEIAR